MPMKRRVRQVCAWIAVFALLFTQLATAAYACPQLVEIAPAAQQSGDCDHLANANLCDSHCDYGSASFDNAKLQPVAPDPAIASLRVVAVMPAGAGIQWVARLERPPTGPPVTRFTVLRI
jgi:hypothetical protein